METTERQTEFIGPCFQGDYASHRHRSALRCFVVGDDLADIAQQAVYGVPDGF
jgi:ribosomal protein S6E (S10)